MFSLQRLLCTFLLVATATASLFPTKSSRLALQTAAEERRNIHSSPLRGNPFDLRQRSLVEACQDDDIGSCVFQAIFDDDVDIYSSCGGLAEANDRWCYDSDLDEDICCGTAEDCCDVKVGAVIGVVIAFIVILTASICGCCYCCKCCCLYDKFHGTEAGAAAQPTVVTAAPVVASEKQEQ